MARTAAETRVGLVTVPRPRDGGWARAIVDKIDNSVKVVAVSSCHWTDGTFVDLVMIGNTCHDFGAISLVDATQALRFVPHLHINVTSVTFS